LQLAIRRCTALSPNAISRSSVTLPVTIATSPKQVFQAATA
jgi:uncharacterized protein YndB with AHSA1/START domain